MIVITGANGHLGRLVVDELLTRTDPAQVVATARSIEKLDDLAGTGVGVRTLDYDRPDTIAAALAGATQVLLISSSAIGQRARQHQAVIDAAVAADVDHLAYTSLLRADVNTMGLAEEHRATEAALAASGLTTTRLRNGWYLENYTENLGPALENGAMIGAAADGRIAAAARADFAAAAAAVLTDEARWGGTYELGGPAFTMAEMAAALSNHTNRTIPYVDMAAEEYQGALVGAGLPSEMAGFLADADLGIARGELDVSSSTLEGLVDRPLISLDDAIAGALAGR